MEAVALQPLNTLESSLNQLITSLTTTNTFSLAPTAAQSLTSADDALLSALDTLRQHQANYARILHLREEAVRLEEQLKGIIRTCVDLKREISEINPGILTEGFYDEDEEQEKNKGVQEVDYKTLLTFAARIGKHNSLAALEAERESTRRKVEAAKLKKEAAGTANDSTAVGGTANGTAQSPSNIVNANSTEESISEVNQLENRVAAQRAQLGMAFPDGEILRLGALGRLQVLREREGEEAVEREVERLVRQSEDVAVSTNTVDAENSERQDDISMSDVRDERDEHGPSQQGQGQQTSQPEQRTSQISRPAAAPVPARRKLDLDFPGSDDDDD